MKLLGRLTGLLLAAMLGWGQLPAHADGLNATYWSNPDFTGTSVTRADPAINFDWNTGSPASGIGTDNFSVRWTGYVKPANSQTYTFYLAADDGCRLWVNGVKLIDDWAFNTTNSERSATIALSANTLYSIRVEYLENSGWADVYLSWSSASQAKQIVPATALFTVAPTPTPVPGTGTGLTGSYYNGRDFSALVATRNDSQVNFDWGGGSPMSGVGVDNFCVRWEGQVQAPTTGTYTFSTTTDDGTRLWVNNQLLVDKWVDQGTTTWSGTISLTAGQKVPLKMEYYENGGGASAKLSWSGPNIASQIVPQAYLYPLSSATPTPTPVAMFGVNLEGPEQNPGTDYYDYPNTRWGGSYYTGSLDYYKARGRRIVRLPLSWERMQPTLYGALDSTQLSKLDSFLSDASARGMMVILDCHNYAKYNGTPIGTGSVDSGALADFWKRMGQHCTTTFAGSVIYGYDLMNEPQIGSSWQAVAQNSITAIRSVDTKTSIFVEGDNWSHARSWPSVNDGLKTLTDPSKNLVFEAHEYFDDGSGTYSGNPTTAPSAQDAINVVSPFVDWCKTNQVRGFLGEFAIPNSAPNNPVNDDAGWDAMLDGLLSYMNTNGMGGTYWAGGTRWDPSERISIEPLSIDTTSQATIAATTDRPQMTVLKKYPG